MRDEVALEPTIGCVKASYDWRNPAEDDEIVLILPLVPTYANPCESEERKRSFENVEEAVENSPPVKNPIVVEVELYPVLTVNGKAKLLVTVSAPFERDSPEPVRSLNDSPLTMRLVVEAVLKEEYMVEEEYGKERLPLDPLIERAARVEVEVPSTVVVERYRLPPAFRNVH